MNPPSEQLVRDYLNRLSVAARGRLGLKDRQGLLERTRARIEVESGGLRDATAEQVRRTLAALGDPIALVENERARIAATSARKDAVRRDVVHHDVPREESDRNDAVRDAGLRALFGGRKNGTNRYGGQILPVQGVPATPAGAVPAAAMPGAATPGDAGHANGRAPASDADAVGSVGATGAGDAVPPVAVEQLEPRQLSAAVPAWPSESNGDARRAGQPGQEGSAHAPGGPDADGSPGSSGISPRAPLPRRAPSAHGGRGANRPPLAPGRSARRSQDPDSSSAPAPNVPHPAGGPPAQPGTGIDFGAAGMEPFEEYDDDGLARLAGGLSELGSALASRLSRLGTEMVAVLVRDRLEAIAIVLLGLGGAIYPPIWIIGVILALCSRKWDHRDKWLGLALPVFLVVFGAMLVVVLGGERQAIGQYATEFWVAAGRLSRLAVILGAGYLLGRAIKYQGKRIKRQPPWTQRDASE